jgi:hypothetical protein
VDNERPLHVDVSLLFKPTVYGYVRQSRVWNRVLLSYQECSSCQQPLHVDVSLLFKPTVYRYVLQWWL